MIDGVKLMVSWWDDNVDVDKELASKALETDEGDRMLMWCHGGVSAIGDGKDST